ncbi:hypothetical protein G6M78_13505 [Agrobacterium tumefaciens]|uniref:hypothetical protein n=1 Tax=Agrobacterium tumefaciens TaxID=358 RepID=UPI001572EC4E|nr:hypothetical protein [Agrobacterium tumefaciens]NTE56088.1 hypothetical protein [Agrobacterium tumefaciens]NTE74202.1 hypothetical protein [Agrobacterium tumefaciens]
MDISDDEAGAAGADDVLERAFSFIRAVLAPQFPPRGVEELADALVGRAIEMLGERA